MLQLYVSLPFGILTGISFTILQLVLLLVPNVPNSVYSNFVLCKKKESVWTFQHIHLIKFQRHHPKVVSVTIVHNYNSICFLLGEKETFILFLNLLDEQISSWRTVLELFFYGVSLFLRWIFSCSSSIMLHEMVYVALGYFLVLFVCLFSGKE